VPERLEKIVAHGKITRGDTVLDVGSGTGILIPIAGYEYPGLPGIKIKVINPEIGNFGNP
jgi:16S rRNA G527 N7-methylase RsmG